jgi:hypothetical protein
MSADGMLPIGTKTPWGKIVAVALLSGERYYFMVKGSDVAMMPADAVEGWDGLPLRRRARREVR